MRAGKLKTRQYKVKRKGGWPLLLAAGVLLGAGLGSYLRGEWKAQTPARISAEPAPTLTPEESRMTETTLSLTGQTWYALQLGVFDQPDGARQQAESYRGRGAGGYVFRKEGYRVLAAAYATRADAQAVMTQIKNQHGVDASVVEIQQPQVTLRLTGQKAQLTALTDACDAMEKLTAHLFQLSSALDRREIQTPDIRKALQSERDTVSALNRQLAIRFPDPAPEPVAALAQLLSDSAQSLDAALNTQSVTRLSAQLKYCHLLCLCRMAAYAAGFGE